VSADTSELLKYASQVASVMDSEQAALSKVVERGAVNVKRDSISILGSYSNRAHLKHYHRSIGYDMVGPLEAEIGPDSSMPQGGMGTGVEFGSVHTKPMPHLFPALDLEAPRLDAQVARIVARGLR
jgi:hypothetical protein